MKSLRTQLLLWLLGAVVVVGLAGGAVIYRNVLAEANAFFDYHLRETAFLLRDQAYGFAPSPGLPQEVPQYDFVVQVWSYDGDRIYLSQPSAVLPAMTTLGFETIDTPAGRWRVFGVLARGNVIQVGQALKVREQRAARLALRTLVPFGLLMPALALLVWWIVGRSLEPLKDLTGSVRARSPAALEPLPTASLPEEVLPLVDALNELLARLSAALEHERSFIADAAHELRSPLTALSLQLQSLGAAESDADRTEAARQLAAGVSRATRLVEQLLTLARQERSMAEEFRDVALDDLARDVVTELVPLADARNIDLASRAPITPWCVAIPTRCTCSSATSWTTPSVTRRRAAGSTSRSTGLTPVSTGRRPSRCRHGARNPGRRTSPGLRPLLPCSRQRLGGQRDRPGDRQGDCGPPCRQHRARAGRRRGRPARAVEFPRRPARLSLI